MLLGLTMIPPKNHRLFSKKTSVPDIWNPLLSCRSKESSRLPKQCRLSLLPLVAHQSLKVSSYCWRQHALQKFGGFELGLTWKSPLRGQAYIVIKGAEQTAKGGKQRIVPPMNCNNDSTARYSQGCDGGTHNLVVTKSCLVGHRACSMKEKLWMVLKI